MEKLKRILVAGLLLTLGLFSLTACGRTHQRGPLDVKKVTYLVGCGGINRDYMYVFTSDLKAVKYVISPDRDDNCDYLAGELPSEENYEVTEFEITDLEWSSIVNVLTRVNFMELEENMSTKELIDDGSSYTICVETSDGTHVSGGYMAGYDKDSDSRRFAKAKEMIENAIPK